VDQAGAQQRQAVVDAVDFGDDVQPGAEVVAVPAAEEVGDQAGGGCEQRNPGEAVLGDTIDGQFPDWQIGDESEVFTLPLDDVIRGEGGRCSARSRGG
jgi:hypothetical protein